MHVKLTAAGHRIGRIDVQVKQNLLDLRSVHIGDDSLDVPTCPDCGGNLRPGVVWFGEAIPERALNESCAAAADCDVFLSVGTSSVVYPAAGLADLAKDNGALVVEINPKPTQSSSNFDFVITEKSGVVLPELVESLSL